MSDELYNGIVIESLVPSAGFDLFNRKIERRISLFNNHGDCNAYALLRRHKKGTMCFWSDKPQSESKLIELAENG